MEGWWSKVDEGMWGLERWWSKLGETCEEDMWGVGGVGEKLLSGSSR